MADTRFVETEALLAVMADDLPKAAQLLETMLPGELDELIQAATNLAILANRTSMIRHGTMP
jgi:hypothetical protein